MISRTTILAGLLASTICAGAAWCAEAGSLSLAAKQGDRAAVQSLLKGVGKDDLAGPQGRAALVWATSRNDLEMVDQLLHAGADANGSNELGATALYAAAALSDAAMTEKLLAAGAQVDKPLLTTGETPLMEASREGNLATVRSLLAAGADPNAKEPAGGHTALMYAASQRQSAVVEELLKHGAQVDVGSKSGFTPLMFAAQQGDAATCRILLGAGAKANLAQPKTGLTPLIIASAMIRPEVVAVLLDNGAEAEVADARGYNPLLSVVRDSSIGINLSARDDIVRIVKLLLAHGANPNFRLNQPKDMPKSKTAKSSIGVALQGATPLLLAAEVNNLEAIKVLIEAGADARIPTEQGTTSLTLAAGGGTNVHRARSAEERAMAIETVKLLAAEGVDIKAVGQFGWTALHGAAYQGLNDVVAFLVSKGADVNAMDKFGQTPLSISMAILTKDIGSRRLQIPRRFQKETAELLLKLGATPLDKSGVQVVFQRTGELELGREDLANQ